jgi:uncharacterized RDD family membrane protein YckC
MEDRKVRKMTNVKAKPVGGFILSLIGGIIIMIAGVLFALIALVVTLPFLLIAETAQLILAGILALVWGILIIIFGVLGYIKSNRIFGIIVFALAIINLVGYWLTTFGADIIYIGSVLSLIGGILIYFGK